MSDAGSSYTGYTPRPAPPFTEPGSGASLVTLYDTGTSKTWGATIPVSAGIRRLPSYPIWMLDNMTYTYATKAHGDLFFAQNPVDGDTVSVGGFTGTFRVTPSSPADIQIGVYIYYSLLNAVAAINAGEPQVNCYIGATGSDLVIVYYTNGSIGNTIGISASSSHVFTVWPSLFGGNDEPTLATWAVSFGYPLDPTGAEGRVVRQIWADGRLIWYAPAGATSGEMIFPNYTNNTGFDASSWTFYPGSETQLPDPIMVGDQGAATTPAYRGMMYLVIVNFPLTDFQCHIPSISAEIADQQYNLTTLDMAGDAVDTPMDVSTQLQLLCNGQPWNYNGITDDKLDFEGAAFFPFDPDDMAMANTGIIIDQDWTLADVLNAYAAFYDFNFAESGFGLKFTKAVTAGSFDIAAVLTEGELISSNQTGGNLLTTRDNTGQIPSIMTVSYYDVSQQYQLSIQRARRQQFPQKTIFNVTVGDLKVPVICTASQALTGCTRALYRAAHGQVFHQFALPPNYAYLEPGDVVQITRRTGKTYFALITYTEVQPDMSMLVSATNVAYNRPGNILGYGGENVLVTIGLGLSVGNFTNQSTIEPLTRS